MKDFIVLYSTKDSLIGEELEAFHCQADDYDHAEEQCEDAYPDAWVAWITETDNVDVARTDYSEYGYDYGDID